MTDDPLRALVRTIPDFPKPGIQFRDITTVVRDASAFSLAIDRMAAVLHGQGITMIAGIEARGFIFGAALAREMRLGFVPIRKKNKLPGPTIGISYALEYGEDRVEIHADAVGPDDRVALVDDLIATGGTAIAATRLLHRVGAAVPLAVFLVDLPDLGGAALLRAEGPEVHSLLAFAGD
ncbi:MAG: hypothetical protein RJB22_120 [Pseudomonadota bacterium]|jgi:adenine phosphoribosyltransferase